MDRDKREKKEPQKYMTSKALIEAVRKRPALWDESIPEYHNRDIKKVLWTQVAKLFVGGSPGSVKKDWDTMRRGLCNKRNTFAKKHGSGSAAAVYVPYLYEKEMSFLDGLRGTDIMEGNLAKRNDDIADERGVFLSQNDVSEDENEGVDGETAEAGEDDIENAETEALSAMDRSVLVQQVSTPESEQTILRPISLNFQSPPEVSSSPFKEVIKLSPQKKHVVFLGDNGGLDKENFSKTDLLNPKKTTVKTLGVGKKRIRMEKCESPISNLHSPKKKLPKIKTNLKDSDEESQVTPEQAHVIPETATVRKERLKREKQIRLEKQRAEVVSKLGSEIEKAKEQQALRKQKHNEPGSKVSSHCCSASTSPLQEAIIEEIRKENDPHALFLLSMADSVKKLPLAAFRQFQLKVIELLVQLEAGIGSGIASEENDKENLQRRFELSPKQMKEVTAILSVKPDDKAVVVGNLMVYGRDLHTLKPRMWLNDQIINAYFELISWTNAEVVAMDTFFLPRLIKKGYESVENWGGKFDVSSKKMILVPVHLKDHWSLIVLNIEEETIMYCDSLGGNYQEGLDAVDEYILQKTTSLDWKTKTCKDMPKQNNAFDCGVFVCMYANYTSQSIPVNFKQCDIPDLRNRIVYEIGNAQLLESF